MTDFLYGFFYTLLVIFGLVVLSVPLVVLIYRRYTKPKTLLTGLSDAQVQRLFNDIMSNTLDELAKSRFPTSEEQVQVLRGGFIPPPALEIGHYLKQCECEHCVNSAKMGGIPMDLFLEQTTLMEGSSFSEDGHEVLNLTTPIMTCTCFSCRQARAEGKPELSPTEARANLLEWNAVHCYPID